MSRSLPSSEHCKELFETSSVERLPVRWCWGLRPKKTPLCSVVDIVSKTTFNYVQFDTLLRMIAWRLHNRRVLEKIWIYIIWRLYGRFSIKVISRLLTVSKAQLQYQIFDSAMTFKPYYEVLFWKKYIASAVSPQNMTISFTLSTALSFGPSGTQLQINMY